MPRPRTGTTPIRHVRVPTEVWSQIEQIAAEENRTKTDVVMEALNRYLVWHRRKNRTKPGE